MGPIIPVILCGGAGTRLWPLSRENAPKQFLPLAGGRSTFAMTLDRVADRNLFERPLVVTSSAHRFLVKEALQDALVDADLLLEPLPRDTAPAIAAAAMVAARRNPDALLMVLAADHLILDTTGFLNTVETARAAAEKGYIITFGVVPDTAATGYGYIARGNALPGLPAVWTVASFKEKPDAAAAHDLVASGCLWNSGNFMVRASLAIAETERHAPEIAGAVATAVDGRLPGAGVTLLAEAPYGAAPATSFDYAVMEKTDRAAVVEAKFDWRDLGTWNSLSQLAPTDAAGNAAFGNAVIKESRGSYVHAAKGTVALLGVDDILVATGGDSVLVAARDRADAIRELVKGLNQNRADDSAEDTFKVSPWGYFQVIEEGAGYKVKRIVVEPGARLSLQKHKHRAEHWVVVGGVAEVTVGEACQRLEANRSIFIPQGSVHRLANPGEDLLTVIEVQYGDYLGEDDIERLSDDYDRVAVSPTV